MARTYADIQKQIEKLQAEADEAREKEVAEVVARIKEAIHVYGLTVTDLFGRAGAARKPKGPTVVLYSDGNGNSWSGRGPRPHWLRDALDAGKKLEDFRV